MLEWCCQKASAPVIEAIIIPDSDDVEMEN